MIAGFNNEELQNALQGHELELEELNLETPNLKSVIPETFDINASDNFELVENNNITQTNNTDEELELDLEDIVQQPLQQQTVVCDQHSNNTVSTEPLTEFTCEGDYIVEFLSKATHIDKKESTAYINVLCENNMMYLYALNIGITLMACYPCEYPSSLPLFVTLQASKLSSQVTTGRKYKFNITTGKIDLFCETKTSTKHLTWNLPSQAFEKETKKLPNTFRTLSQHNYVDTVANTELNQLFTLLGTYLKLNVQNYRDIAFDKRFAYVQGLGFYAFCQKEMKNKYVFSERLVNLIQGMTSSILMKEYYMFLGINDDNLYEVNAHNYIATFPVNNAYAGFKITESIKPTRLYELNLSEFKEIMADINAYSETNCAITLGSKITIINKNSEGNAVSVITPKSVKDLVEVEDVDKTYPFNYDKLNSLVSKIKGNSFFLSEANTGEHLLLMDNKMKHSVLLSVR